MDEQTGGGERSPDDIRRDIEQTREEMGDTVEALAVKADVKGRAEERADEVKEQARAKAEEVRERVSEAAAQAADAAPESAQQAAQQAAHAAQHGFEQAVAATRTNPAGGLGAAFAAGLAVGWLLGRR